MISRLIPSAAPPSLVAPRSSLGHDERGSGAVTRKDIALAGFSVVFLVIAVALSGIQQLMLCCIAYVPGIVFYIMARKEQGLRVFTPLERAVAIFIALVALAMIAVIAQGALTL